MTRAGKMTIGTGLLLYPLILGLLFLTPSNLVLPLPFLLPMFLGVFGLIIYIGLFLIGPIFWVWNRGAFDGDKNIPRKSIILFSGAIILSGLLCLQTFPTMRKYCGDQITLTFYGTSTVWVIGLIGIWWQNRRQATLTLNLLFHWLLFSWLLTYAFPVVMTDSI